MRETLIWHTPPQNTICINHKAQGWLIILLVMVSDGYLTHYMEIGYHPSYNLVWRCCGALINPEHAINIHLFFYIHFQESTEGSMSSVTPSTPCQSPTLVRLRQQRSLFSTQSHLLLFFYMLHIMLLPLTEKPECSTTSKSRNECTIINQYSVIKHQLRNKNVYLFAERSWWFRIFSNNTIDEFKTIICKYPS